MIYIKLFYTFFKVGAFTFGGGLAMLALIQEEVVKNGWISQEEILNFVAISESTPGPFAINISTFSGMTTAGILGAMCATLGIVLPSFLIILLVAKAYQKYQNSKIVKGLMSGLTPAVIGLIASVAISTFRTIFLKGTGLAQPFFTIGFWIRMVVLAVMYYLTIKKVHPIFVIALSAVIGIFASQFFYI